MPTSKMQVQIVGDGAFGSFLKDLLAPHFDIVPVADTVIMAVPISAYEEVGKANAGKHLVNVCSVQKPSTDICLKHSERVTSIHPLFGPRTPADKRNTIISHLFTGDNDTWLSQVDTENQFINGFSKVSQMHMKLGDKFFTPELHDQLMAKTHLVAAIGARQMKVLVERVQDVPDELIPNSFRQLRAFVQTLEDMPKGTMESIMANPYL